MTTQAPGTPQKTAHWRTHHTIIVLLIVVATPLLVRWLLLANPPLLDGSTVTIATDDKLLYIWWIWVAALTLFAVVAGGGMTGRRLAGWLINEQYRMSLSRLQMLLWTIVVLASLATAVAMNLVNNHLDTALQVAIPAELWLVLGISTTSLVASPLILADKKRQPTNVPEAKRTLARMDMRFAEAQPEEQAQTVQQKFDGQVERNTSPQDASFADLLRGEQTANADVLDVARLQNLFFTLVLLFVYVVTLLQSFQQQAAAHAVISEFPPLNAAFVALLGISTTGYLAAKAVNYQPPNPAEA